MTLPCIQRRNLFSQNVGWTFYTHRALPAMVKYNFTIYLSSCNIVKKTRSEIHYSHLHWSTSKCKMMQICAFAPWRKGNHFWLFSVVPINSDLVYNGGLWEIDIWKIRITFMFLQYIWGWLRYSQISPQEVKKKVENGKEYLLFVYFLLENMWISEFSIGTLKILRHSSDLSIMKSISAVSFS